MSKKSRDGDERGFAEAMRGVRRIEESRRRDLPRRRPVGSGEGSRSAPVFGIERQASRFYGLRDGGARTHLDDLRAGLLRPANRLDLHGMSQEAARQAVFSFVRQARSSGLGVIGVIHGRGLRSPDGPVLKEALPDWLTQLPLSREIVAFGSAPLGQGGDGVTLIVLERG